jgi:hypothetical protein
MWQKLILYRLWGYGYNPEYVMLCFVVGPLSETEVCECNYSMCDKQDKLNPWNTVVFKLIVTQLVERNTTSFEETYVSGKAT